MPNKRPAALLVLAALSKSQAPKPNIPKPVRHERSKKSGKSVLGEGDVVETGVVEPSEPSDMVAKTSEHSTGDNGTKKVSRRTSRAPGDAAVKRRNSCPPSNPEDAPSTRRPSVSDMSEYHIQLDPARPEENSQVPTLTSSVAKLKKLQQPPALQQGTTASHGFTRGLKTSKMLQTELEQLNKELIASKEAEEDVKQNLAAMQQNLASIRETEESSRQEASEAHHEIEQLREKVARVGELEADKRVAAETYQGVKALLQSQLTTAHVKLHEAQGEVKLYQLELEKKTAVAEQQKSEKTEQIKCLQEECEKLEMSISTAKTEHLNAQALLEAKLVSASEREQEACEQIKLLQVELQERTVSIEEQQREASMKVQSLEQENDKLNQERIVLLQMHEDARASLQAELDLAQENKLKAQQHVAMLETELRDQAAAFGLKELEEQEQIESLEGKIAVFEEQLTLERTSAQTRQEELSRNLATTQETQHQDNALNLELREQFANAQLLVCNTVTRIARCGARQGCMWDAGWNARLLHIWGLLCVSTHQGCTIAILSGSHELGSCYIFTVFFHVLG